MDRAGRQHSSKSRAGARFVVAVVAWWSVWAMSPPLALAAPGATQAVDGTQALGQRLGECLGREDPVCIRGVLEAVESATGAGFTLRYAKGYLALLEARFDRARELLGALADDAAAPKVLRERARSMARVAASTATVVARHRPTPIVDGAFEVWVEPGPDEVLVPLFDEVLRRAAPALVKVFGPLPAAPIRIFVYGRAEQLAATTGLTETQIKTSGTIAVCKYNRLMVTSPRALVFGYAYADTVTHELVHLLVTRRGGDRVPVWLHEALARSHEALWRGVAPGDLEREERVLLDRARRRRDWVTLRQMSPSIAALPSQERAQLAFAEVHHLLAWLLAPEGRSVQRLLDRFGAGDDAPSALAAMTGEPWARTESAWLRALRRGEGYEPPPPDAEAAMPLAFKGAGAGGKAAVSRGQRHVELGDRLLALERPLAAVLEYRKAMAKGATVDVMMATRLGRALLALGRLDEAASEVKAALARFAQHAPLLLLAGQVALGRGDASQALEHAQQAAWHNPFDPGVPALAAAALDALGKADAAASWRARGRQIAR